MRNHKQIWYIISSIFFAVVLFIYATTTNYQNNLELPDKPSLKHIPIPCLVSQLISNTIAKSILLVVLHLKYQ